MHFTIWLYIYYYYHFSSETIDIEMKACWRLVLKR